MDPIPHSSLFPVPLLPEEQRFPYLLNSFPGICNPQLIPLLTPGGGAGMGGVGNMEGKTGGIQDADFPALFLVSPQPGAAKPSLLPRESPGVGVGGMGEPKWDFLLQGSCAGIQTLLSMDLMKKEAQGFSWRWDRDSSHWNLDTSTQMFPIPAPALAAPAVMGRRKYGKAPGWEDQGRI